MTEAERLWSAYIDAWNSHNIDAIVAAVAEQFVYDERPMTMSDSGPRPARLPRVFEDRVQDVPRPADSDHDVRYRVVPRRRGIGDERNICRNAGERQTGLGAGGVRVRSRRRMARA